MTQPHELPPRPGSRLLWALRFHARAVTALALVLMFLTSVAVGRMYVEPTTYTATATAIATELEFSAERVPRLAEAIYQQDSVLADAIERGDLPYTVDELRDRWSSVTPLENNVLILVEGHGRTEDAAIRTADAVAAALVDAWNRSGTEALLSVQDRALRGIEDDIRPEVLATALGGLIATTAGVLGLAGLLLALRRPVTRPAEATAATGVPVLTVVEVPRHARPLLPLRGLDALQRALSQRGVGIVVFTATAEGAALRSDVAESYAATVSDDVPTTFVPAEGAHGERPPGLDGFPVRVHDRGEPLGRDAGYVVVDGFDYEDAAWRESLPEGVTGVVVVPEGTKLNDLTTVLDRFVPEDLAGMVFVSRIGSLRRHAKRRRRQPVRGRWAKHARLSTRVAHGERLPSPPAVRALETGAAPVERTPAASPAAGSAVAVGTSGTGWAEDRGPGPVPAVAGGDVHAPVPPSGDGHGEGGGTALHQDPA